MTFRVGFDSWRRDELISRRWMFDISNFDTGAVHSSANSSGKMPTALKFLESGGFVFVRNNICTLRDASRQYPIEIDNVNKVLNANILSN